MLRLHQRLMIRDDGSRFGTQVNGRRVHDAFLAHGDRLTLGQVVLECEVEDLVASPPQTSDGLYLVDPKLFGVLCDLEHPCVARGLQRFLRFSADLEWVERQAARLYHDPSAIRRCAQVVCESCRRNAQRARELLPQLAGVATAAGSDAWDAGLDAVELGPQLLPVGWFQPSG